MANAITDADIVKQAPGRVRTTSAYKTVLKGQEGTLQSVTPDSKTATVSLDWLTLPTSMSGHMKPEPNIGADVPFDILEAI